MVIGMVIGVITDDKEGGDKRGNGDRGDDRRGGDMGWLTPYLTPGESGDKG